MLYMVYISSHITVFVKWTESLTVKTFAVSVAEIQSTPPPLLFRGPRVSITHPHNNLSLQNVNSHPRKCTPLKKGLATSKLQVYRITQKSPLPPLSLGGCQFAFWKLRLSRGCFTEKGGAPKGGGVLWASRNLLWVKALHVSFVTFPFFLIETKIKGPMN